MGRKSVTTVSELLELENAGKLCGLFDVPADVYHAGPGIGSSNVRDLLRSGAHYKASIEGKNKDEEDELNERESKALLFGSAAHCAILEPDIFDIHYWTINPKDKLDWRTKEGKAQRQELLDKHQGKTELSYKMFLQIAELSEYARSHPKVSKLLEGSLAEVSAYSPCPTTGVLRKIRPDCYNQKKGIVVDFKTTVDARPDSFLRSIIKHGYHIQAAYYLDALTSLNLPATAWCFIAIEKKRPYGIGLYMLSDQFLQLGRRKYQEGLATYAQCKSEGIWSNYSDRVEMLDLPRWIDSFDDSESEW